MMGVGVLKICIHSTRHDLEENASFSKTYLFLISNENVRGDD